MTLWSSGTITRGGAGVSGKETEVKIYDVVFNGKATTMQLSEEDAARLGAREVKAKRAPANKAAAKPSNKAGA